LGQCDPVAKTGFDLTGPFFGTGSCRPAGTREPSPRAPHGVGSAGQPAGGPVWASWTQFPNRTSSSQTCFGNWEMRTGRAPANPFPALPTGWGALGNLWGGSLGQFGRAVKTGHALVNPFFGTGSCGPAGTRMRFHFSLSKKKIDDFDFDDDMRYRDGGGLRGGDSGLRGGNRSASSSSVINWKTASGSFSRGNRTVASTESCREKKSNSGLCSSSSNEAIEQRFNRNNRSAASTETFESQ
jgi:hypothetical protein